jgi:hypothetical protein
MARTLWPVKPRVSQRAERRCTGRRFRPVCEPAEDRLLLTVFTVTSAADTTTGGTVRQMIQSANNSPGLDTIKFNIPGSGGTQTILIQSPLPSITDPLFLDGTSQPGYAGVPLIQLDGSSAGSNVTGLYVSAGNSTIKGLDISSFGGAGIALVSNDNVVQSNFIGTAPTGKIAAGNGADGVIIYGSATGNLIGVNGADANAAAEGNVLSGNHGSGVRITGTGANQNSVAGNTIGLDVTGTAALGNTDRGVDIDGGAQGNRIGSNSDGQGDALERNIISANHWEGVAIIGSSQNVVAGNDVGTDKTGTLALGNSLNGVALWGGSASNRIGSNLDGVNDASEANLISGNLENGVSIADSGSDHNTVQGDLIGCDVTGTSVLGNDGIGVEVSGTAQANTIRLNDIYGNGFLGIDLGGDSVTINDATDADTGPNQLLHYPVITSTSPGSTTAVAGSFSDAASSTFTLDFYASAVPDRSLYGQAERYLGSTTVTTNAAGQASFAVVLPAASQSGEWLSATATDPAGNTSEFSAARRLPTAALTLSSTAWTPIGPATIAATGYAGGQPFSGKIDALAADPTNPKVIYIGSGTGGVWKTTDGGTTWTPLTDTQATLSTGAIALAPSNPSVVYVGTGETTFSGNSYYGRGILKSTDAGATWTLLANSLLDRMAISQIVVDPADPQTVYVATSAAVVNGAGFAGKNIGVLKSTDGGSTWTDTTQSIPNINRVWDDFSALVMDPGDASHQTLYTAVCSPSGASFGYSAGSGVYKTTNGGMSWTLLGGGMPSGAVVGLTKLALSPSAPQTVYASIVGTGQAGSSASGSLFMMLKSTNGGSSWSQLTNAPNYFEPERQGWFDSTLAVDPANANVVYAGAGDGTYTFMESTDGGNSWADLSLGSPASPNVFSDSAPHADHHGIGFDANGRLLDGDDGGLFRLDNPAPGQIQWTDLNGNLQITQFVGIALDPQNPNLAYGGSQDNGTEIFNGATGWTQTRGGDGGFVRVDPSNSKTIYHTYNWGGGVGADGLERSDDGGAVWSPKTNGINLSDPVSFYPPYVIDSANPSRLLFATNRVYETTNRGDNWAPISTVGTNGWPSTLDLPIQGLAVSASSPNTIYVVERDASGDPHVLVTFNDGSTWQERDIPGVSNTFAYLSEIDVDPENNQVAYAVRDEFNDVFATGHVFRTMDGGQTWSDISGNLPDLPTHTLAIDPRNGALYVGNDQGVYVSANLGGSWSRFGTGLPNVRIGQLELSTTLNILAAGTYGRGMWEISVPAVQLHLTPSAPSVTAGSTFQLTVSAVDGSGHPLTSYTGTVHFTSSDTRVVLPADYTFNSSDAGTHIFGGLILKTAGGRLITATDIATSSVTASTTMTVNPAAVSTLTVGGYQSPATAGVSGSFTVTAQDAYGNIVPAYAGTVHFTSTDSNAALPSDYPFASTDQGSHVFTVTLKTSGTQAVRARDTVHTTITAVQTGILVNPAAASTFRVAFPSTATAGVAQGFNVTVQDAYGNTVTSYTGTVHFTSTDARAVLPAEFTFPASDNGTARFAATFETAGSQSIALTDTANSSIKGQTVGIAVSPASASTFLVGYPSATTAGVPQSFLVTAYDAYGNVATGYTGTVHFTSNETHAVLPADYTFTSSDAGKRSFDATLKTSGTWAIRARDTAHSTVTGVKTGITVSPASLSRFALNFPTATTAGQAQSFVVTGYDAYGNIATGYTGTVQFTSSDSHAVLPSPYPFVPADAGQHTFSATLKTTGTWSVRVSDSAHPSLTGLETGIVVSPAVASKVVVSGYPKATTVGTSNSFTVTLYDAYGNVATGYTGTIQLSSDDPAITIAPTEWTFGASDAGTHTFTAKFGTQGTHSLKATDTKSPALNGSETGIVVS